MPDYSDYWRGRAERALTPCASQMTARTYMKMYDRHASLAFPELRSLLVERWFGKRTRRQGRRHVFVPFMHVSYARFCCSDHPLMRRAIHPLKLAETDILSAHAARYDS